MFLYGSTYGGYGYDSYNRINSAAGAGFAIGGFMSFLFYLLCTLIIISIIAKWRIFKKAGQPGWAALVPFYNKYKMLEITSMPLWAFIIAFVPGLNISITFIERIRLAKAFGKGEGTGLLLFFFPVIMFPVLAFGDSKYKAIKDFEMKSDTQINA